MRYAELQPALQMRRVESVDTLRGLNARVDATGSIRSTATRWLDDEQLP